MRNNSEMLLLKKNYEAAMYKQIPNNIRWAFIESSFEVFQFIVKLIVLSVGIYFISQ